MQKIRVEAEDKQHLQYQKEEKHTVFLNPVDNSLGGTSDAWKNTLVTSSKGCITDDQINSDSCLKQLYHSSEFTTFVKEVLREDALFPYGDALSSVNIHYASYLQELGWHFDNSSFAVTLMIEPVPIGKGGVFACYPHLRELPEHECRDRLGRSWPVHLEPTHL